jgi:2-polyprenyl-3-methyl-5-hydroxy-6-metoxy-1,4-benzoquinol methylase
MTMSESWDQYAEGWHTSEDVILYAEKAYQALTEIVNPEGLTILDFGCGTGLLTAKMAPVARRILALDTSAKMISVLKNKQLRNVDTLSIELSEETIKTNDLLHAKFDLIVASSVCAFLPDYERTLQVLKTLLKPQGLFIQWDWLKRDDDSDFGFTEEIIESAFLEAGLEVWSITKAFSIESNEGAMPVLMGVAQNA